MGWRIARGAAEVPYRKRRASHDDHDPALGGQPRHRARGGRSSPRRRDATPDRRPHRTGVTRRTAGERCFSHYERRGRHRADRPRVDLDSRSPMSRSEWRSAKRASTEGRGWSSLVGRTTVQPRRPQSRRRRGGGGRATLPRSCSRCRGRRPARCRRPRSRRCARQPVRRWPRGAPDVRRNGRRPSRWSQGRQSRRRPPPPGGRHPPRFAAGRRGMPPAHRGGRGPG